MSSIYLYLYIIYIILLRQPGIEPGPHRWQRRILTIELLAQIYIILMLYPGFEPGLPRPQRGVLTTRLIELIIIYII